MMFWKCSFECVALAVVLAVAAPMWAQTEKPAKPKTDAKTPDAKTPDKAKTDKAKTDKAKTDKAKTDKAAPDKGSNKAETEVLAGHSAHGEAFNEGARQKAYLMQGTGKVNFKVTTKNDLVQKFIHQGVGQIHGFWYFEAERSFRQAAAIEPKCAMAYWGMALANRGNAKRGKGFIAEAVKRKAGISERETMYIDALNAYIKAGSKNNKTRGQAYVKAMERILYKYPDDLDAKAFLALQMWSNRGRGIPISSYLAIDALLKQVHAIEPMHPCHHYRIHLWDIERSPNAVNSAALCGQAAPGIAHMWHMPGHIFSRLKRYDDAAWQQEASARVDHAHMIRDRVLPDRIHNFAHNNEWLIRNLTHVGRVHDAVDLARNMTELPRHPKYNTLTKRGSSYYGRLRLFEVLSLYEQWDTLIQLAGTPYLEPTEKASEQVKRLRYLGRAYFRNGDVENGKKQLTPLEDRLKKKQEAQNKAVVAAEAKAKKEKKDAKAITKAKTAAKTPFNNDIRSLQRAVNELKGHVALAASDFKTALDEFKKAGGIDAPFLASVQLQSGDKTLAEKTVRDHSAKNKNEVQPLAHFIDILWQCDKKEEAEKSLNELREISGAIDLDVEVFEKLNPIAAELGMPDDWRIVKDPKPDTGKRPNLDSLGPFRWHPSPAAEWTLKDAAGKTHTLQDYRGKPVVVIFYLGYGCLHCAEQLQAFAPKAKEFAEAGLSVVAVSSDDAADLQKSVQDYEDGEFPFPLVSNSQLDVFKAYRAYDDFENVTMHGTFLIDSTGLVRWQDISYEPFKDPSFVIKEAKRLLGQQPRKTAAK